MDEIARTEDEGQDTERLAGRVDRRVIRRHFPNGLTVSELKAIIAAWPEVDQSGEPTQVWMETGLHCSSIVKLVVPLNQRGVTADLLLGISGCDASA